MDLLDRLTRLQALQRGLVMFHADCLSMSRHYWPKPMRERARASMFKHDAAAKCIRRRIDRMVKRGIL